MSSSTWEAEQEDPVSKKLYRPALFPSPFEDKKYMQERD